MSRRQPKTRTPAPAASAHVAKTAGPKPLYLGLSRNQWILNALALLIVYACLSTWFQFDFSDVMGYHSMFAQALLKGRLYVDITPDQMRLMDMIRYQGRHYLQWGPTPGFIHLIPAIFGFNLSDRVACLLAGWASSLLFLYMILLLRQRYFPSLPKWVCLFAFWMFALGSTTALVVLRPTVYDETIALATLFVLIGFVAFLHFEENPRISLALLCGFAVALAATTRITLGLYGLVFFFGIAAILYFRKTPLPSILVTLSVFSAPLVLGIAVQLYYNYERFGSPWAYFPRYELDAATIAPVFNFRRIPENLCHYLLALPEVTRDFPWMAHKGWQPIRFVVRAEEMSSMFLTTPVLLLGLLALRLYRPKDGHPLRLKIAVGVAGVAALLEFGSLLLFRSASRRYMHDFMPFLLVVAFVGVALLWKESANWNRWKAPAALVLVYMMAMHAHMAFTHSFVSLPSDLNVIRAVTDFGPIFRAILPGPNLDREEAIARNDIGTLYLRQRRFRDALEQFERAEKLMPDSEVIQKNLRATQQLVGQP